MLSLVKYLSRVRHMLSAYIPHLCGQEEFRVCKWLWIWEGQISGFPKKSGVGYLVRVNSFFVPCTPSWDEGFARIFV